MHPQANVRKMASGTPLTDEDRWPWRSAIAARIAAEAAPVIVVSCSALKRAYRDLSAPNPRAPSGSSTCTAPRRFCPSG